MWGRGGQLGGSPVSRQDKTKGILDEVPFEAAFFFFFQPEVLGNTY